jgi:hypothetical protein
LILSASCSWLRSAQAAQLGAEENEQAGGRIKGRNDIPHPTLSLSTPPD